MRRSASIMGAYKTGSSQILDFFPSLLCPCSSSAFLIDTAQPSNLITPSSNPNMRGMST